VAAIHPKDDRAIILFDGVCNLCNGFVNFIIDHDPEAHFQFAALQSEAARTLLREPEDGGRPGDTAIGSEDGLLRSVVLIENGDVYRKSAAALRIARHLTGWWPLLTVLLAVPRAVRDRLYDRVAARRYDWFGKQDECRVPTPDVRHRFLDQAAAESRSATEQETEVGSQSETRH
jgi:predicted DCC family thiol-disulfide oxidoreductase YuxK